MSAEAPTQNGPEPEANIGGISGLYQSWRLRKDADDATLRFVITALTLDLFDGNSAAIDSREVCPWGQDMSSGDSRQICRDAQRAAVEIQYEASVPDSVDARGVRHSTIIYDKSSVVALVGFNEQTTPVVTMGSRRIEGSW